LLPVRPGDSSLTAAEVPSREIRSAGHSFGLDRRPRSRGRLSVKILPSILAADCLRLGEQIADAERGGADRFHIDIMDGLFVPNLSLGIPIVEAMRRGTELPLEIHLMIERPERYTEAFIKAGGDLLILHQEATPNLHRAIQQVRHAGKQIGVGLNPATPLATVEDVVESLDLLLLMTVNPGFGGQQFIQEVMPKLTRARALLQQRALRCELEVDGGVDLTTGPIAAAAGADVFVAGTCVFAHPDGPGAGVQALRKALKPGPPARI
jgi:ribulose-phosphate 3-epimerase